MVRLYIYSIVLLQQHGSPQILLPEYLHRIILWEILGPHSSAAEVLHFFRMLHVIGSQFVTDVSGHCIETELIHCSPILCQPLHITCTGVMRGGEGCCATACARLICRKQRLCISEDNKSFKLNEQVMGHVVSVCVQTLLRYSVMFSSTSSSHHLPPRISSFDLFWHRRIAIISWGVHDIFFLEVCI